MELYAAGCMMKARTRAKLAPGSQSRGGGGSSEGVDDVMGPCSSAGFCPSEILLEGTNGTLLPSVSCGVSPPRRNLCQLIFVLLYIVLFVFVFHPPVKHFWKRF